jgi:pilus assembly protein CpaB
VSSTDKVVVTLALDPAAAESVVWTMEHGTLWLSLDPKGADASGTRLVTPENVFG